MKLYRRFVKKELHFGGGCLVSLVLDQGDLEAGSFLQE